MYTAEEKALVEDAQLGNRLALTDLLAACYPRLLRTARSLLGEGADAQDAAQEAALSVFENIHQLKNTEAFTAWSNTIVRRTCSNYLRNRQMIGLRNVSFDESSVDHVSGGDESRPEARAQLAEIFGHAGESMREILMYRLVLGLSVSEAAAVLGLSEGAVKLRLHRARRKAKNLVGA